MTISIEQILQHEPQDVFTKGSKEICALCRQAADSATHGPSLDELTDAELELRDRMLEANVEHTMALRQLERAGMSANYTSLQVSRLEYLMARLVQRMFTIEERLTFEVEVLEALTNQHQQQIVRAQEPKLATPMQPRNGIIIPPPGSTGLGRG